MNEANNVLTIKTVQIQPIRNMITAIKDILTDATITFTKDGLKIINFDKTHTILVNVNLNAQKFEQYNCIPDKIICQSEKTLVIDYKTGKKSPKHIIQIEEYISILQAMKFPNVQGALVYLNSNKPDIVELLKI